MKLAILIALTSLGAFATAYEKSTSWSAKWSSLAGAAAAGAGGADALFFNPAGIGDMTENAQVSINGAMNLTTTSTPLNADQIEQSETSNEQALGLLYAYEANDRVSLAVGFYNVTNIDNRYPEVKYLNATYPGSKPPVVDEIVNYMYTNELSFGLGYKFTKKFSAGISWRILFADSDFSDVFPRQSSVGHIRCHDLNTIANDGIKLGFKWKEENWGLGLTYRNRVNLDMEGYCNSKAIDNNTIHIASGDSTLDVVLPEKLELGGYYNLNSNWRLNGQVDYVAYAGNSPFNLESTNIQGTSAPASGGNNNAKDILNSKFDKEWDDQLIYRLSAEYLSESWDYRFGYAYSSQVIPSKRAHPTYGVPSGEHVITAGAGKKFISGNVELDFGISYAFAKGDGVRETQTGNFDFELDGESQYRSFGAQASCKVNF